MPGALAKQIVAIAAGTDWGDILGFLPTTATIDDAIDRINQLLANKGLKSRFDVYPLLSKTETHISDKAIAPRSRGQKRRIVVSSNLAETSLTVEGVRFVVDSGLICQPEWDPSLASGSCPTRAHSRSGVRQRWGRVGRDAPGWVFPLYTVDQFLAMSSNTPPGAAQKNLESFYMKLLATGMNLDEAVLPVSFRHESLSYDADGLKVMQTFEQESTRAQRALRLAGAVDGDGHLTEYGRELESFPGNGSEALALMMAEQLACVHEVALALHVFGNGYLTGKRIECILQVDSEWPSAWRVAAIQRHAALAVGCKDDLDILLRIFALWGKASDPSAWCATWWINEAAIEAAWSAALETVKTLSDAMKGEASRAIEPLLGGRARAVLTRTMVSCRYARQEGSLFRAMNDADALGEAVQLSSAELVETGDHVMAFHRFRVAPRGGQESGTAFISHIVELVPWATGDAVGSSDSGFDLLTRAATHLRDRPDASVTAGEQLADVISTFPVGDLVDLELEQAASDTWPITRIKLFANGMKRPAVREKWTDDEVTFRDATSVLDREWDPIGTPPGADILDEEETSQFFDPRETDQHEVREAHRRLSGDQVPALVTNAVMEEESQGHNGDHEEDVNALKVRLASVEAELRLLDEESAQGLAAISVSPALPLAAKMRSRIVGYRIHGSHVALVIEPVDAQTPIDPADHSDVECGQEVPLTVCGAVRDQESQLVRLARADGKGYFYAASMGLSYYDRDCLARLTTGASVVGMVIRDGPDATTVTVLPVFAEQLATSPRETHLDDGEPTTYYPAKVLASANSWGKVSVELDQGDKAIGLSHRFEARLTDLRKIGMPDPQPGKPLLVALGAGHNKGRTSIGITGRSGRLTAFIDEHSEDLGLDGNQMVLRRGTVGVDVICALEPLGASDEWSRNLWELYSDSLHRSVTAVRPQLVTHRIQCEPAIMSLLLVRQLDVQQVLGVTLRTGDGPNEVLISDQDEAKAQSAASVIRQLNTLPRARVKIPDKTAGLVLGPKHANRIRLESQAGVQWVWLDGSIVGVIGDQRQSVQRVLREIREAVESATGDLLIPATKNGLLIGAKGATIGRLKSATGCRARSDGGKWTIDGPNAAAVNEFIRLATQIVTGTGRVLSTREARIVEDTTGGRAKKGAERSTASGEGKQGGPCFIATACYGDSAHPDVVALRVWRDTVLVRSSLGRAAILLYRNLSPPFARALEGWPGAATIVRVLVVRPTAHLIRKAMGDVS